VTSGDREEKGSRRGISRQVWPMGCWISMHVECILRGSNLAGLVLLELAAKVQKA
jgi:hypothetical protein